MDVVRLRLLKQLIIFPPPVDHTTVHWDSLVKHLVQKVTRAGGPHCIDASLRQSQIDRLGEIERRR